jgi:hypothetical protein
MMIQQLFIMIYIVCALKISNGAAQVGRPEKVGGGMNKVIPFSLVANQKRWLHVQNAPYVNYRKKVCFWKGRNGKKKRYLSLVNYR